MSNSREISMNLDQMLGMNKYNIDEEHAHIEFVEEPDTQEFEKLVLVCPAALYRIDAQGAKSFDYAGCLECGTCRIICGDTIIKKWENPKPTRGVVYRFG
jgi:ferredoxin-like protein FixX